MRKNFVVFFIVLIVSGMFGCTKTPQEQQDFQDTQQTGTPQQTEDVAVVSSELLSQTYTDAKDGFSFQYPEDWTTQENFMGARIFVAGPPVDKFAPNLNIVILPKDETIFSATEDEYKKMFQIYLRNIEIQKFQKKKFVNRDAVYIHYKAEMGENNLLEFKQYLFIVGEQNYTITLTDKQGNFSKHEEIFDAILSSFKF